MDFKSEKDVTLRLIQSSCELEKSLLVFKDINQKAHFIALNAAIEGARMKSKLGTFSIVANQIAAQAAQNSELSEKLESLIQKIKSLSLEAVAVRNLELAADLIDKLDRNLFERNCDVQAWATFDSVKNALLNPGEETTHTASEQLDKLVSIYMVYADSFLLDSAGNVVAAAKKRNSIGSDFSRDPWFLSTLTGNVTVTDVFHYPVLDALTVCYCSPVMSAEGKPIGVLVNCFDWNFALEMIQSGDYGPRTKAIVVNSSSDLIAARQPKQILRDNYEWLSGGKFAARGGVGYSLEYARNGEPISVGFCHTKGYNAYKGKGWSAVISECMGDLRLKIGSTLTEARGENAAELQVEKREVKPGEIESERSGQRLLAIMKEIDELVFGINGNNREVKLLAVNASIQAGLAGADGEGFSIIANEVAALAKKSLNFVESVNATTAQLNKAVEHSSSVRLLDAAKDTMSKIDRNLFERYCDIQAWSTFSKFLEVLEGGGRADESTLALLEQVHKIYEVYHDIYILNLEGKVVGTAINRALIGHDFSRKDWFSSAVAGNTHFSDIYTSEALKIPLITFSAPIFNAEKSIVGVIASRFNCNFLNDILRAAIVDSSSEILLVNQEGTVIASKENSDVLKRNFGEITPTKNFQAGECGSFEQAGSKKEESFNVGYASSKGYNSYRGQRWVLLTRRPNEAESRVIKLTPAERFRQRVKKVS